MKLGRNASCDKLKRSRCGTQKLTKDNTALIFKWSYIITFNTLQINVDTVGFASNLWNYHNHNDA